MITPLLRHDVTVSASAETASLAHYVTVGTSGTDTLQHDLTVTRHLATANAVGYRLVGMRLAMDLGTGTMETVPSSQIGGDVRIAESFDTYADQIDFTLLGSSYSPFVSALIRGRRQFRVTGMLGSSGASIQERVLFDGYVHQCGFTTDPPGVRVQGYDGATAFVGKRLVWTEEPGSRKTRGEIFRDICAYYGITLGTQDFGSNDGGIIVKPISEGGGSEAELLDWLREFVKPIGRVIYFSGGALHVVRPRTASTADRTLYAVDIAPGMDVGLPAVTNANVVTAAGVVYEYTQVSLGEKTVTRTEPTSGTYAPVQASNKQSKTDGAVTAVTQTQTAVTREVSRKVITETRLDGSLTYRKTERWAWYAPKAPRYQQDTSGVVTHNAAIDVYAFPDGSWRSDEVETFRPVEILEERYTYSGAGFLSDIQADSYYFRNPVSIFGTVGTVNPTTLSAFTACYITHDGFSVADSADTFSTTTAARRSTWGSYVFDADDGRVTNSQTVEYMRGQRGTGREAASGKVVLVGGQVNGCYDEAENLWAFIVFDDDVPRGELQIVWDSANDRRSIQRAFSGTPVGEYPPTILAKQAAKDARVSVRDAVQIALNGEHYYYIHDEAAEIEEELRTLAWEELREQGHWPVSLGMVEDLLLHKGSTVAIIRPDVGLTSATGKFLVWSVDRSFNLAQGRFSMRIGAKFYPPELDTE